MASFWPGLDELLEYNRRAVAEGQIWRLFTGQLVHWTPRMTLADLGVILFLGAWLERSSPRILVGSLVSAAALVGAGVQFFARDLSLYRGSSGLATAVFTSAALVVTCDSRRRWRHRGLGLLAILVVVSKILWEVRQGAAVAAGEFPRGVQVAPVVHMLGALAGLGTFLICLLRERRRPTG